MCLSFRSLVLSVFPFFLSFFLFHCSFNSFLFFFSDIKKVKASDEQTVADHQCHPTEVVRCACTPFNKRMKLIREQLHQRKEKKRSKGGWDCQRPSMDR